MSLPTEIKIAERTFPIEYKKGLKRTSSVRIKNGKVVLRLSRYVFGKTRDEMVQKFLDWARKQLAKASETDFVNPVYKDGASLCTHNKVYELKVIEGRSPWSKLKDGYVIELHLPFFDNDKVEEMVRKVIIRDQMPYLQEVISELNDLYFKGKYKLCRFKKMNSRFGSCSLRRNLNIAYRLLFAPREVFRYVCVHELAHLKEFNHSSRFWDLVETAMPDYKKQNKWLKDNGFLLG
jgi:predicted metal-dependent hydrolase